MGSHLAAAATRDCHCRHSPVNCHGNSLPLAFCCTRFGASPGATRMGLTSSFLRATNSTACLSGLVYPHVLISACPILCHQNTSARGAVNVTQVAHRLLLQSLKGHQGDKRPTNLRK